MARKLIIAFLFTSFLGIFLWKTGFLMWDMMPLPSGGETIINGEENEGNLEKRQQWFDLMHQTPGNVDWKKLVYRTNLKRHQERLAGFRAKPRNGLKESFADSTITGVWKERGSLNQAGSVYETYYDVEEDVVYLISAGGSLWKGKIDGSFWEVINQDLQFDRHFLELVNTPNGKRILTLSGRLPHFSDDMGITWEMGEGIPLADGGGNSFYPAITRDSIVYVLSKPSNWDDLVLYKSFDYGASYQEILEFQTHDPDLIMMDSPEGSDDIFIVEKEAAGIRLLKLDLQADSLIPLSFESSIEFGTVRANLTSVLDGDSPVRLYLYTEGSGGPADVYLSTDLGENWEFKGTIPERPWSVGLYASPSDPDRLFTGGVEAYRSLNGGSDWTKVNNWGDYYNDVEHKLHADIMHFREFKDPNGNPFLLISNHGGLSISYNDLISNINIGLEGLNVSQYYSVRTSPESPYYVFAGSQDQGFQRSFTYDQQIAEFDQVISGDYGHIVLTDGGAKLWTVYPGGAVYYYSNPEVGNPAANTEINSINESVWLPPLMADPFGDGKVIFMAGGNINGGAGSYLIRLEAGFNGIVKTQLPFDFKAASGGEISALGTSPVNPLHWYVTTTNGYFFFSKDGGSSWTVSTDLLSSGQWLYGQSILASSVDAETVIVGGNGYQGPAAWISEDGGETFQPFDEGLPPTLIIDMTTNEDESLIFAATETGPYVYSKTLESWYDMSGICAPAQTYWSVEYVSEFNTIRFGTYGRGIWDFVIDQEVNVEEVQTASSETRFLIQPNPASTNFKLKINSSVSSFHGIAQLTDLRGRKIEEKELHVLHEIFEMDFNVERLPSGVYFLTLYVEGQIVETLKVLKTN